MSKIFIALQIFSPGRYNDVAVFESEKDFGLIGRNVTRVDHIHNRPLSDVVVLPANERVQATIKLNPDAKPVFCSVRNFPLAMEAQVKIELWRNFRLNESLPQSIQ